MAYQVQYAEEADAPSLAQINTLSFEGRGLLSQFFPETSPAALEAYKSMYAMKHLANPQMHVLKVTDPDSGAIVGYGRWHIPESLYPRSNLPVLSEKAQEAAKDPLQFAPRPMNEALFAAFRGLLEESRKKHMRDNDMSKTLLVIALSHCLYSVVNVSPVLGYLLTFLNSAGLVSHIADSPKARNWVDPLAMGHGQGG